MIKREQVENILKINGVAPTSPDEQIRSILLSARYSKDEVNTAIMVLRENSRTNQTRVDGLHKIFRSDETLRPEEISQLLGIDIDPNQFMERPTHTRELTAWHHVIMWGLSILLALSGILVYMYLYQIGIFHPSAMMALVSHG
ncbi:MAG: hypothetical protein ACOC4E_00975 [Patescibacteria group bacterium]